MSNPLNVNSPQPTREVFFPIIEDISVDGYALYPGNEFHKGLTHHFVPGVNVILGINGIGKTTLLTLIYRMLTGNRDLRHGEELGGSQRKDIQADPNILSKRVPDRAINAKATLKFRLNDRQVTITRSLKDLSLEAMTLDSNGDQISMADELEDRYKMTVSSLAGVDDFFDWILILRYLAFYLEDRRSLVWDKWAQTEIFRILFLPEVTQFKYKTLLNKALSADSLARNTQSVVTNQEKRLDKLKKEVENAGPEDLKILRASNDGLTDRYKRVSLNLDNLDKTRLEARDNAARLRSDAEKLSQQERELREKLLSNIFPKLTDYGALALASIESLRGCLVCGCTDDNHLSLIREKIHDKLTCPICEADPDLQEKTTHSDDFESDKDKLTSLAQRVKIIKDDTRVAEQAEESALQKFKALQFEKYDIEKELRASSEKLSIAEIAAGILDKKTISTEMERLQGFRDSVEEHKTEKDEALIELKSLVDDISHNVASFKEQLINDFEKIVTNFLAEKCELTYRTVSRNIGQSSSPIALLFPEFHVLMTSGVFRDSGTPREEAETVSESQKEFIELAFRMAILSSSASHNGCSIIIETPEANLDAVFIPKAGQALNEFSRKNPQFPSTIIATSNLNGSEMIPALLGILEKTNGSAEIINIVSKQTLNLLHFAAKSAALREFSTQYDLELQKSLKVVA
jgi:hypothetical protein